MTTFKIIAKTNSYIANRDITFNGKSEVIIESGLSLKEAQSKLLDLYNDKYDCERPFAKNWGLAVIQSKPFLFGALPTYHDGTRSFDWDSRMYSIEIEEDEETI